MTTLKMDKSKLSSNSWLKLNEDFYLESDKLLGKGAFGEVYRGYSVKRDTYVAIKTMEDSGEHERQIQTLKALSSLNHPNIMGYYGFEILKGNVYMYVQFCPNGTLTDLIKEGVKEEDALRLFRQLIEGMCYMNAKSKMHRDLKPDNILIGLEKDIKISDFGLARESTSNIFMSGQMGTPIYAGPEVYLCAMQEDNYSQNCDVWGAGLILYELLTGKMLFAHVKTYEELKKQWMLYEKGQRRVQYPPKLHPNWQYFTNFMLTFDHKKRPTFHQVLEKLKKVYDKMASQISKNEVQSFKEGTKIGKLERFLNFQLEKYNILIKICDNFTQKDISIRNQFKFMIMFLCLAQYLCHVKKLIRNLKYKRVKINEDDDQQLIEEDNQEFDMVLDKFRNLYEHKYNFFNDQIRSNIIPKILDDYNTRIDPDCKKLMNEVQNIVEMAIQVKDGTIDVEETYSDAFKDLIQKKIDIYHKNLEIFNQQELKIYNIILLGSLLLEKFPNQRYAEKRYIETILEAIHKKDKHALLVDISKLKQELK